MQEIVELIKRGDNVLLKEKLKGNPFVASSRTAQGISLLQFAAYCRNKEAVDIIRTYKDELDVFEAATVGDKEVLLHLIEENPGRINEYSVDGFTLLGLASFFDHIGLVEILLQKGADPNIISDNTFKVTPLHSACAVSNYEIAVLLIKHGANVNVRQLNGVTPLHSAAHNGRHDLVQLLIDNGAETHATMDTGQTPLQLAEENGSIETIKVFRDSETH